MGYVLTNIGEEWYTETAINGSTVIYALYNDTNDSIAVTDDVSAITEPSGTDYSRQSDTVSVSDMGGDWGFDNDNTVTFAVGDASMTVDSIAMIVNFDSDHAGDGGTETDHLIATAALDQSYDLSQSNEVNIVSGEATVTISS